MEQIKATTILCVKKNNEVSVSDENKVVETAEITSFRTHKKSVLRILTWTNRRKRVRFFH